MGPFLPLKASCLELNVALYSYLLSIKAVYNCTPRAAWVLQVSPYT